MNVLVFLAGIVDPRKPFPSRIDAASLAQHRADAGVLSPFDEAALELALKLRDDHAADTITAVLPVQSAQDPLMRHVASFRLDAVWTLDARELPLADMQVVAHGLVDLVRDQATAFDVLLIGREFGDADDGTVPALLAQGLDCTFVSQALSVTAQANEVTVLRQAGANQEAWQVPTPFVAAITNDAGNRLRHPLLKNVMAARKFVPHRVQVARAHAPRLDLQSVEGVEDSERTTHCRMLPGDVQAQADALAALLMR